VVHLPLALPSIYFLSSFLSHVTVKLSLVSPSSNLTPSLLSLVLPQIKLEAEYMEVDGDFIVGLKEQG
jgi:hypothetical protein